MTKATLVLEVARSAAELLAADDVRRQWGRPSALHGYDVGGLAGHLARAVLTLESYLDAAEPSSEPDATDAAGYYVAVLSDHHPVDSGFHADVRRRGAEAAAQGPDALQARLADAIDRLTSRLPAADLSRPVEVLHGVTLPLGEYVKTRVVELVVHLDDLAVSVGRQGAEVPEPALRVVAGVLGEVAAARAGGLQTVRSLARAERHPDAVRAL